MNLADEVLRYAWEHAGTWMPRLPAAARVVVRDGVVAYLKGVHGDRTSRVTMREVSSTLFASFGQLNLDWDLIARTEAGECQLQGFIASRGPGTAVRRMEAYTGACMTCSGLHGRVFMVVPPDAAAKDWATQVWRGKSAIHGPAPVRPSDPTWPSAGLQHPGCRGLWTAVASPPLGMSPGFVGHLEHLLARRRA